MALISRIELASVHFGDRPVAGFKTKIALKRDANFIGYTICWSEMEV